MIGIYKITSPSGKIYIGQSSNIKKRMNSYKAMNCKAQVRLHRSFLKYGFENHIIDIIEVCDIDRLNELEVIYIEKYQSCGKKGLNCMIGGAAPKHSAESRKKMSDYNILRMQDKDYREKLIKHFMEISIAKKVYKRSPSTTAKIIATKKERGTLRMKQESIDKYTKNLRQKFKDDPSLTEKMKSIRTDSSGNFKKVKCKVTGRTWPSCKDMCLETGLNLRYTCKQLSGSRINFTQYEYV